MDRKKVIIGSLIASFVIVLAGFFYVYYQRNGQNQTNNQTAGNGNNQINNFQIPNNKNTVNNKNSAVVSSSQYILNDIKTSGDIKKDVNTYLNDQLASGTKNPIVWAKVSDSKGQTVSLDNFTQAVGIKINDSVFGLLKKDDYNLVTCRSISGKSDVGLVIAVKLFENNYSNLYQDELDFMKKWEPYMFKDLHALIFPTKNFTQAELDQKIQFQDGLYRYSQIDSTTEIHYNIVDDFIVVSSSDFCVQKTSTDLLGTD
jgi:hypothetical protein